MPDKKRPDPSDKSVIILAGKHAGEEGFCLGPTGEEGIYAVTPNGSNGVLRLKFDAEFGILINAGQRVGRS